MKIDVLNIAKLLICIICPALSFAQGDRKKYDLDKNDSMKNVFLDGRKAFLDERLNEQFPSLGLRKTIDNKVYNFDQTGRCRVIEFGFSDCAPCRVQLPYFIKLSNNKQYANIDFLYITYDDSATIMKDIRSLYHGSIEHLKIFSIDRDYFSNPERPVLTYGFPTMYFINNRSIVKAIIIGGRPAASKDVEDELKTKWTNNIDSLSCY